MGVVCTRSFKKLDLFRFGRFISVAVAILMGFYDTISFQIRNVFVQRIQVRVDGRLNDICADTVTTV